MKRRFFKFFSRTTLISLEIAAITFGLMFLVCGAIVWKLMSGPINVGFAKDYIEQALHDPVSGYSVSLEQVEVEWPHWRSPIALKFSNVDLIKNNRSVLEINDVSLEIAARYLFIGDIKPISISLQNPSAHLIRTATNEIRLSLEDDVEENDSGEDPFVNIIGVLSAKPSDAMQDSPLSHLESISINDAKAVIADYKLGMTWFLSPFSIGFAKDPQGLIITTDITLPGGRDSISNIQGDLVYLREAEKFIANIHVTDFDPHILSSKVEDLAWLNDHYVIVNGNIELAFDRNFNIEKTALSLSSVNGEVKLEGVYDAPFPYEELFIEASYDKLAGKADLKGLGVRTKDVAVTISAPIELTETNFSGSVNIEIPSLQQTAISSLWPDSLRGEGAEEWLTKKLSEGAFSEIKTSLALKGIKENDTWSIDVDDIISDFKIEDMDIDYRAPLRKITDANGTGHFENDILTLEIAEGHLGDIRINKGKAVLDKIIAGKGRAEIDINLSGPLQSVFRYIQPEPIGVSEEKLGLDIDKVKGNANLDVHVGFPTVKDLLAEQVIVKAGGTLGEVLLPDVVKTLDLTGGPFKIDIKDGAAKLSGNGQLEGRAIDFEWMEYVESEGKDFVSRVKAKLTADKSLRETLGIGLNDWIEGSFPVDVTYTEYGGGRSVADVKADLSPGTVKIDVLEYQKPPGKRSDATCKVVFKQGRVSEVKDLDITTEELKITNARFLFSNSGNDTIMKSASLPTFVLNENDLNLEIETGVNDLLKLAVKGSFLDARPFLGDKKKTGQYDGPALLVSVNVDRMRTHPARMVDSAKLYLDMNKNGDIDQFEMDAVAGKGDIYVRLKPNEKGLMSIRLEADDAGAMLKAFDLYDNARGGKIRLYGEAKSPQERKILFGKAEMTDFYIVKAPALAQLLNAISLFGIQQLLGGDGIYFSRLESDFQWQMRREGDAYYFEEGRTSGSSLGLTFEGRIDKAQDLIKIEGTIVPVSFVNELVSNIPLIGDILTGGGGGIIAATYKFEGPIKNPKVNVNPLSALAPGILRTILFE